MLRRATLLILLALFVHVFGFADDCDGRGVRRHFTIQSIPEQHVEAGYLWNYAGDVSVCGQCGWATNVPTAPTELSMNWGDGTSTPLSINMAGGQPHTTKASHTYDKPSGDPGVSLNLMQRPRRIALQAGDSFGNLSPVMGNSSPNQQQDAQLDMISLRLPRCMCTQQTNPLV
jgi:hypothetical protein